MVNQDDDKPSKSAKTHLTDKAGKTHAKSSKADAPTFAPTITAIPTSYSPTATPTITAMPTTIEPTLSPTTGKAKKQNGKSAKKAALTGKAGKTHAKSSKADAPTLAPTITAIPTSYSPTATPTITAMPTTIEPTLSPTTGKSNKMSGKSDKKKNGKAEPWQKWKGCRAHIGTHIGTHIDPHGTVE
jgi:hypothetical protein